MTCALLGLAGCETQPKDDSTLLQARGAVTQAEADPNVAKYAATELDRARKLLVNAEGAAKEKGAGNVTAAHYAYLATQMARIAEQPTTAAVAWGAPSGIDRVRSDLAFRPAGGLPIGAGWPPRAAERRVSASAGRGRAEG